jgi:hypothetical protein
MANFRKDTQTFGPTGHDRTVFEVPMIANKNGEVVTKENPFPVTFSQSIGPSAGTSTTNDAFGRLRVSEPFTLFDSSFRYYDNTEKWSTSETDNSGNSSYTHNANEGLMDLTVGSSSGDSIIRETKRIFSYQPGKSLLVLNTFCMNSPKTYLRQRVGYFGTDNGFYLEQENSNVYIVKRSKVTGSVINTRVIQGNWNIDTLDGSGVSSYTLDLTKSQILWMDFEWLGVGSVRVGFVINGQFIPVHVFHHANLISTTYMTTATLPLRCEITNTDATSSSSTLKQICSSVMSEGGYNTVSISRSVSTDITGKNISNTSDTPLISIRLKSGRTDGVVIPKAANFYGLQQAAFQYKIYNNVTSLTNASWTSLGNDSLIEYDLSATALTGGNLMMQGIFVGSVTGSAQSIDFSQYDHSLQLGRSLGSATGDIFTIAIKATSNNDDAVGSLNWQEHN